MKVESRAECKEVLNKFRLPILAGNDVQFYGFEANELTHMQDLLVANGGRAANGPAERTHLVVDENTVEVLPAALEDGQGRVVLEEHPDRSSRQGCSSWLEERARASVPQYFKEHWTLLSLNPSWGGCKCFCL